MTDNTFYLKPNNPSEPDDLTMAKQQLETLGVTVFGPILENEELDQAETLFWQAMTTLNPNINPTERSTWNNKTFPGEFSTGIYAHYGLAQSDFAWYLRCYPKLHQIFASLHNIESDDLVTSMDAISVQFDHRNKKKSWLHRDQVPWLKEGDLLSLQGVWNRYPVTETDGGFICCPGSHLWDIDRPTNGKITKGHYMPLKPTDPLQNQAKLLLLDENCFTIFNSRLLHSNCSAVKNRANHPINENPLLNRLGCYISMWPKAHRSDKVLQEKQHLYYLGQGSSHWGIHATKKQLLPRWPRSENSDQIGYLLPTLTEFGDIPAERLALL